MPLAEMAAACRAAACRAGRRRPRAGRDRRRHRRARRRLVRRQPAQVGVRAAQLRRALGRAGTARGLHPGVISWGVTSGDWLQEFDWTGTRDPSPWLAAPAGLDFMHDVLGVDAMREHNHRSLGERARLAGRWRRPWTTPEPMVGCMVTCPCPSVSVRRAATAQRLRDALLEHASRRR